MRIGVVTLEPHTNYGGLIQAAAMGCMLRELENEAYLISRKPARPLVQSVLSYILRHFPGQNISNVRANALKRKRYNEFVEKHFCEPGVRLSTAHALCQFAQNKNLDALIVGSDQVWRVDYISEDGLPFYFLALGPEFTGLRLSYAASFGTGEWILPERIDDVSGWLSDFDAVSCRENSGTRLVQELFGRSDAVTVLDPTLVVDSAFYELNAEEPRSQDPYVLGYILEERAELSATINKLSGAFGGGSSIKNLGIEPNLPYLSVSKWLSAFRDASFVLTDSFHGVVLCLRFNKNFIAFGRRERGIDRFTSLLGELNLLDRLIDSADCGRVAEIAANPIEYEPVNIKLGELRKQSMNFLASSLLRPTSASEGTPRS